jgi:atypical dual specificity phosphatase
MHPLIQTVRIALTLGSPMNLIVDLHKNNRYGQLYLGNINAANDAKYLREHSVSAVVAVIDTSEIHYDPTMKRLVESVINF